MHFSTLFGLAASIATAQAVSQGFNYGNTLTDGTAKAQSDFEAEFKRAQTLQGTSGFTSARLYTMIQGGTTNTPIAAIQAAIDTKTSLLLGMWASGGNASFSNEVAALTSAITQYGSDFTDLIVGISVGSEDLYRNSPTGIENDSGAGASPDDLVSYIKETRAAISGTSASGAQIGHVDTWNAWQNGSNSEVASNCDWLGMDTYPYFQNTVDNSIDQAKGLFWDAYNIVKTAAGSKDVWITESGWPVSGKTENKGVPSTQNAETYWQEVACQLLGKYNTWWYTLQDAEPTTPNPSFGIIGSDLSSAPLYDLTCKNTTNTTSSSSSSGFGTSTKSGSHSTATGHGSQSPGSGHGLGIPYLGGGANGTASASGTAAMSTGAAATGASGATPGASTAASGGASSTASGGVSAQTGGAAKAGSAVGAGILAIVGLVAAL